MKHRIRKTSPLRPNLAYCPAHDDPHDEIEQRFLALWLDLARLQDTLRSYEIIPLKPRAHGRLPRKSYKPRRKVA